MPTDPKLVRDLFLGAAEIPAAERAAYLTAHCGGDPELRAAIERLLAAHDEPASVLNRPAPGMPTADYPPVAERPGTVVGPYKLLQEIGEGGFGVVYMAEQQKPVRRTVALKIIKPGMDTAQVIARFESERQALALMDHPNIARVLDAGATDTGRPYFVMELVKGVPITEFCDKNRLLAAKRLKLFVDVCHAIQHAHHKGVIHRDIKPSNVMVTLHDGLPVVKVIDFGVAKATAQKLTEKTLFTAYGQMVGTPAYMSPEQAEMSGLDIDTRSDIFSMGVLLYELLTGTTPLSKQQLCEAGYAEMQRLIREEDVPRPSTRLSSLGGEATVLSGNRGTDPKQLARLLAGELDWIVMKALEKDRNRRYSTPGDFAEDVERYLRQEAILACPPSLGYKLKKFAQRNRAAAVTAAVVVVALAGGAIAATFGMIAANRAEHRTVEQRDRATQERDAAVAARRETFDALTDLTDTTVGDLLAEKREAGPEAREFFDRVVKRYERLAAGQPDAAESDDIRARCLKSVGDVYRYLGSYEQALKAYGQAADLCRGRQARAPEDAAAAGTLFSCLSRTQLAYLDMRRNEDVDRTIDEPVTLAEKLHRQFPEEREITCELARLHVARKTALPTFSVKLAVETRAGKQQPMSVITSMARLPNAFIDTDRAIALLEHEVARDGKGRDILADALGLRSRDFVMIDDLEKASADVERVSKLAEKYNDFNLQIKCCQCRIDYGVALNFSVNLKRGAQRSSAAQNRTGANPGLDSPPQSPADHSASLAQEDLQASHSGSIAQFQLAASKLERMEVAYPGSEAVRQALHACYENMQYPLKLVGREGEAREYFQRDVALMARDPKAKLGTFSAVTFKKDSLATAEEALAAGGRKEASENLDQAMRDVRRMLEMVEPASLDEQTLTTLSQQCRAVARVAEKLERWPEAIEFDRRQVELEHGAGRTDLLKDGNSSLARDCLAAGRPDQARAAWEELIRLDAFSNRGKEDYNLHRDIADLGAKLAAEGQQADIDSVLAPGLEERRKRLAVEPADEKVRNELRRAYRTQGNVQEYAHRFSAALRAYDQGLALGPYRKSEAPFDFDDPIYSLIYADTLTGRAVCLDALGRADEADQAFKASDVSSSFRATKLAENGQPERAIKLAEGWLREEKSSVGKHYDAACVYATASACESLEPDLKGQYADRAVALLGEARALGYFDDPEHVAQAKSKGALEPLRQREDFKKLLAELEARETE
jgi:serine/threonine protein kinase